MSPFNPFAKKKLKKTDGTEVDADEFFKKIDAETLSVEEFRNRTMAYVWYDQMDKLRDLCEDQIIMAPLFFEKLIEEIKPGNRWNDVLFLLARKMLEAYPDPIIAVFENQLMKKRPLVPHPDGGREVMAPFVKFS